MSSCLCMSMDGQGTECRRKIAEIYNRLSRVHERYRQTIDDGRTGDSKWHFDPCSRLATIDMGQKLGGCALLGELGPHLTQCVLGRGLPPDQLIQPAVWPQQTWAENWRTVPLCGGGVGSPSNTMWPGPRLHAEFYVDPPNRLATIHQRHRETDWTLDRQTDRQRDNRPIA